MDEQRPREIAFDCRFFLGDRPCVWHKSEGAVCTCDHYVKRSERLLIIKLDAMGDVLRTTALLPAIAEAHPGAAISWITRPESVPLLQNNPYLTDIIPYGVDALVHLGSRLFDRVINLDAGATSAGLAAIAQSPRKDGFVLEEGSVKATNPAARAWLEMGLFDDLKRSGTRTYQDTMASILGLEGRNHHYVLELTEPERARARAHMRSLGIDPDLPLVGLNTGAGGRWELKQWRENGFIDLIETMSRTGNVQFILLGGPGERERNARLRAAARATVFDAGCDNAVRHFAALTACCDVVVSGDTLAMHLALATRTRAVVLFGPTSAQEIELYGLGEKVVPDLRCLGCYKSACDFVPNCMDAISVEMVSAALARQLEIARVGVAESAAVLSN
jgi:ADP-heptose:LPS heptosyltransferase